MVDQYLPWNIIRRFRGPDFLDHLPDRIAPPFHETGEGIRFDVTNAIHNSSVKLLSPDGVISAASASQICDGSSAVLVVSEKALSLHNLTPLARIVNLTVTAGDPVIMLEEPLFATIKALKKAGLSLQDIDLFEVNEAFAPIPMAWLQHVKADPDLLNVNGGAIALGTRSAHPAPNSCPPSSTRSAPEKSATGCRPCAKAAALQTLRLSRRCKKKVRVFFF